MTATTPESFPHEVPSSPPIALLSTCEETVLQGTLVGFTFDTARIDIDPTANLLGPRALVYSVLTSVGLSRAQIGRYTDRKEGAVISRLAASYLLLEGDARWGRPHLPRANLARFYIATGLYQIRTHLTPVLELDPEEESIVTQLSLGRTSREIGDELRLSERTVKTRQTGINRRTGLRGREQIILAGLLSQTIPLIETPPSPPGEQY